MSGFLGSDLDNHSHPEGLDDDPEGNPSGLDDDPEGNPSGLDDDLEGSEGVTEHNNWVVAASGALVTIVKRQKCVVCKQLCPEGTTHDCTALQEQKSEFTRLFQCHRCGDIFTPMSSLGQHQCSCHPGKYVDNQWTCCGRTKRDVTSRYVFNGLWSRRNHQPTYPKDPPGCTPCDHFNTDVPRNASAFGKDVDIQLDLPFAVMCNLVPGPTERLGWRTKLGKDNRKIGVLTAIGESPAVKKRKLNAEYSFVIQDIQRYRQDPDDGDDPEITDLPLEEAFTLKHKQSFVDLEDREHRWNIPQWECLRRLETGEKMNLEKTIGELIKDYGLVSGEVFNPFYVHDEDEDDEDGLFGD